MFFFSFISRIITSLCTINSLYFTSLCTILFSSFTSLCMICSSSFTFCFFAFAYFNSPLPLKTFFCLSLHTLNYTSTHPYTFDTHVFTHSQHAVEKIRSALTSAAARRSTARYDQTRTVLLRRSATASLTCLIPL